MTQHLRSPKIHVCMGNNAHHSSKQTPLESRLAIKTIMASRDRLRRRYLEAMTRTPWLAATVELEVNITNNQMKYTGVSQGKLIDELGEECIRSIPPKAFDDSNDRSDRIARLNTTIQIPVDFFYSGPDQFPYYRIYGAGQNRYQVSHGGRLSPEDGGHDQAPIGLDNMPNSTLSPGRASSYHYFRHQRMEREQAIYLGYE